MTPRSSTNHNKRYLVNLRSFNRPPRNKKAPIWSQKNLEGRVSLRWNFSANFLNSLGFSPCFTKHQPNWFVFWKSYVLVSVQHKKKQGARHSARFISTSHLLPGAWAPWVSRTSCPTCVWDDLTCMASTRFLHENHPFLPKKMQEKPTFFYGVSLNHTHLKNILVKLDHFPK